MNIRIALSSALVGLLAALTPAGAAADPSPARTNSDIVALVCDDGSTYSAIHNFQAGFSENFFVTAESGIFVAVSLGFPGEPPFFFVEGFRHNGRALVTCTVDKRGTTVVVVGFFTPARQ